MCCVVQIFSYSHRTSVMHLFNGSVFFPSKNFSWIHVSCLSWSRRRYFFFEICTAREAPDVVEMSLFYPRHRCIHLLVCLSLAYISKDPI
jgi:hypothetical protein